MSAHSGEIQLPAAKPTREPGTFRRMFWEWLPFYDAGTGNPVFPFASRGYPDAQLLRTRTGRWIQQPLLLLFGLWVVFACLIVLTDSDLSLYSGVTSVIWIGIGLSLLDKFVLDFAAVTAGLDVVDNDVSGGRWDLIALSDVRTRQYVKAYHAASQIRSWRMMCRVMGFRLGLAVLAFLHFGILPLLIRQSWLDAQYYGYFGPRVSSPFTGVAETVRDDPALIIFYAPLFLTLLMMTAYYVVEPRWRVRALAAGSIAVSAKCAKPPLNLMYALGCGFGIWLGQILTGVTSYILLMLLGMLGNTLLFTDAGQYFVGFAALIYFILIWLITRAMYLDYTNRWLTRAHKRMIILGGAGW